LSESQGKEYQEKKLEMQKATVENLLIQVRRRRMMPATTDSNFFRYALGLLGFFYLQILKIFLCRILSCPLVNIVNHYQEQSSNNNCIPNNLKP
jgi:hypothetical protein